MRRYLPQLDGLRAVAVLMVFALHATWLHTGYVGVEIFFVLSGYLITTILLDQQDAGERSLRRFYARRMRRLYPALATMLLLTFPFDSLFIMGSAEHRIAATALAASYLADFGAAGGIDWMGGLIHTWSLALEEQFYLLWPLVLPLVVGRRGRLMLVAIVGAMLAGLSVGPLAVIFLPFTQGGVILIGCLLALALRESPVRHPDVLAATSLVALALVVAFAPAAGSRFEGAGSVAAGLVSVGLVAGLVNGTLVARGMSARPLVWVGQRSYGIYLWHVPIIVALPHLRRIPAPPTVADSVIALCGGTLMAALSYRLIEARFRPGARLGDLLDGQEVLGARGSPEAA